MKKKILITPLNWGIGHATRCIPIIQLLLQNKAEVFVASDGAALLFLKEEFPALIFFELPAYNPIYPSGENMVLKMAMQLPKFTHAILQEQKAVQKIVKENKIDLVISDNRYGCYTKDCTCIFMTHQLSILMPKAAAVLGKMINYLNQKQIEKFDQLWIPDFEDKRNLSGDLSFGTIRNKKFIGQLSRFKKQNNSEKKYDIAFNSLTQAETIWRTKTGSKSNINAASIYTLTGDVYYQLKNYKKAEEFYNRGKDLYNRFFSSNHPEYVKVLSKLAKVYYMEKEFKRAKKNIEEALGNYENFIKQYFPALSEREKAKYWNTIKADFEFYNTLAFGQLEDFRDLSGKVHVRA